MNVKHRQTCRVCGNYNLQEVIDLGAQYLQGSFVKEGMTKPSARKISTRLVRCNTSKFEDGCGLVQTSVTTPPKILYANYWYQSGISQTMRNHLKEIVRQAMDIMGINQTVNSGNPHERPTYSALDIASNDGTLLKCYPPAMVKCGIDPSDIARNVSMDNCTIINDLFPTEKLDKDVRFDIITSIAMFYDLEDPVSFVKKIEKHLKQNGIWIGEVAYLPATLEQVSYDTIVGEHLTYYSLSTLEAVFKRAGMRIFRAELNDTNGGSIKFFCCSEKCFTHDTEQSDKFLNELRMKEFDLELDTDTPYSIFRSKVTIQKHELQKLVQKIKDERKTIHLYGASTKCNTLLQYCELDHTSIPYAAERSKEKWGAKTLGTNIQIISEEESKALKPDYYLVGPWHFKNEILKREADTINKLGIKFIFPLPNIEIVEKV